MENDRYIIKSLKAINVIFDRLTAWNAHSKNWIPPDHGEAFETLYQEFRRLQRRFPLGYVDKLEGWECGLYQVLDIRNQEICEMLPLLLTAYMYNYVRKSIPFVQKFQKSGFPIKWKIHPPLAPNAFYFGEKPDFDSCEITDTGIGKLLSGLGGATEQELRTYAKAFSFPRLKTVPLMQDLPDGTAAVTSEYIIPVRGQSIFFKNVHKRNLRTDSGEILKESYYSGERFEFYPTHLLSLGLRWMYIISQVTSPSETTSKSFACEPKLYDCYRSLLTIVSPEEPPATPYDGLEPSKREDAIKRELTKLFSSK